eukprot:CAMPEP_0172385840 /NCGR_PEP_ID=MMETSP1061-20121228/3452_1 /TAXON_ID=37318 /ORGANISM="Pseudo-nitzschia pungens, Strain cf. pungens" /LENGTH=554 /DNA_ID=CAMNT_0013114997 /DNA_START=285 /DNA_END=1952 /DNA_ORIENTATION=+
MNVDEDERNDKLKEGTSHSALHASQKHLQAKDQSTQISNNNIVHETVNVNIPLSFHSDDNSSVGMNESVVTAEYLDAFKKKLSEEQWKLDHNDRVLINEEVHGVSSLSREESTSLIRTSLANLCFELCELVRKDTQIEAVVAALAAREVPNRSLLQSSFAAGYMMSQWESHKNNSGTHTNTGSAYVNCMEFRLRFLRCEDFDAKKAAIRMMKYLNLVYELFGYFALFRPIKLSDFTRRELKILQSGWLQVLPYRDRSGRRVLVWVGKMGFELDPILRIKLNTYVFLAGTRDPESQRKGVVALVWPQTSSSSATWTHDIFAMNTTYIYYCKRLIDALPMKPRAVHYCILTDNQSRWSPLLELLCKMTLTLCSRVSLVNRMRIHFGTLLEMRNILAGYGILANQVPVTNSNTVKCQHFKQWLKLQHRIEEEPVAVSTFIDCPQSNDVVFRSGSTMIHNPGNVVFRGLIESKIQDWYTNGATWTSPKTKDDIATEIVQEVLENRKGRFLTWDSKDDCWKEMTDMSQVKTKVAIAYRDLKLKLIKIQDQKMSVRYADS